MYNERFGDSGFCFIYNKMPTISNNISFNNFIDTFFDCESELPDDEYFDEYSLIFSHFLTKIDLINEKHHIGEIG
ncbi:hypothetical protein [Methanobrevibacter filiformis]|uniref:Uncharacterized protein n=1 Tax=Methanobrevibacter filiformis TaxID=55758 RepID=A0A165ZTS2_9EURY|nr:hypothetical protein [Methanobrevibacter filiformis]KZX11151.1 hypothetical protein MBFIL_15160 [Methanobrevibacter filiformis]